MGASREGSVFKKSIFRQAPRERSDASLSVGFGNPQRPDANPKRDQSASADPALFVRGGDVASARRIGSVEVLAGPQQRDAFTLGYHPAYPYTPSNRRCCPWPG